MKHLYLIPALMLCSACTPSSIINTDLPGKSSNPLPTRIGTATKTTWFGLWETGDASTDTAQQNGGITEISSVSSATDNYLWIYKRETTTVRGE